MAGACYTRAGDSGRVSLLLRRKQVAGEEGLPCRSLVSDGARLNITQKNTGDASGGLVCWSSNGGPFYLQVKSSGVLSFGDWWMAAPPDDDGPSSTVSITVLSVKPVKFGKIFALASVEIDIDGVLLVIHGVRAIRLHPIGTRIDLPMFRDENGVWRHAITLPDQICAPIGRAVLDELVERGLAIRGPALCEFRK
jgi:hypothetical protein